MAGAVRDHACERFRRELSSFVDHTLPERRWQRVARHVAGCELCRGEAEALRGVCRKLSGAAGAPSAPDELAERLRRIAGDEHDAPLYLATGGHAGLPSRRRGVASGVRTVVLAGVALTGGAAVLAFLLAPEPPRVHQPLHLAESQFAAMAALLGEEQAARAVPVALGSAAGFHHAEEASGSEREWCVGLEHCPRELGGLPLVAYRAADSGDEMLLAYFDGGSLLTVCWQRGRLADTAERAPEPADGIHVMSWQTASGVVTVGTDGEPATLAAAALDLPPRGDYDPSPWERLREGADRLLGVN